MLPRRDFRFADPFRRLDSFRPPNTTKRKTTRPFERQIRIAAPSVEMSLDAADTSVRATLGDKPQIIVRYNRICSNTYSIYKIAAVPVQRLQK
jgi:hypothetical protein